MSRDEWIADAAAALAAGQSGDGVTVIKAQPPPLLDRAGIQAVLAPVLAALVWSGAVFREVVAGSPIDPLALLLRAVAFALTVRAVLLGAGFARRLAVWAGLSRWGLALTDGGLLLRTSDGDATVARSEVVAVVERGDWRTRKSGRRWSDVYVVTQPESGRLFLAVPPIFDRSAGILAERLMRWRGPIEAPADHQWPEPARLGSRVYDDAAKGTVDAGVTVIRHGRGWIAKGPYATVLLGLAVADGFVRLGEIDLDEIGVLLPLGIAACASAVPVIWAWLTRRHVAPRKGLALVLTPAELLIRTRSGILRTTWRGLARITIATKASWTILEGYHGARTMVIERRDAPAIRYDEAFLGVPAEVVVALCEAHRSGVIPLARRPADPPATGA